MNSVVEKSMELCENLGEMRGLQRARNLISEENAEEPILEKKRPSLEADFELLTTSIAMVRESVSNLLAEAYSRKEEFEEVDDDTLVH